MEMFHTLVLISASIFNSIGSSSQSGRNLHSERNPGPPHSDRQHPTVQTSTEESSSRARSRSPSSRPPPSRIVGYSIEDLGYMRLIPRTNQSLTFEFRSYIFPPDSKICWRADGTNVTPMQPQEHIVLSTSDGEVFAILSNSGSLSGMVMSKRNYPRVKINMMSTKVNYLTPDEIRDCPVGRNRPIFPENFVRVSSDYDSLQFTWNSNGECTPRSVPTRQHFPDSSPPQEHPYDARSKSPPGRPPTHEIFGHSLAKLGYIRLIPHMNPNQRFEFRRYVFPATRGINLIIGTNKFAPVSTREHIVLSTSNGDVYAILEYTGILRGTYKLNREIRGKYARIRINMMSGEIHHMTEFEITECLVGKTYPLSKRWFNEIVSDEDSLLKLYE